MSGFLSEAVRRRLPAVLLGASVVAGAAAIRLAGWPWPASDTDGFAAILGGRHELTAWLSGSPVVPDIRSGLHNLLLGLLDRAGLTPGQMMVYPLLAGLATVALVGRQALRTWGPLGAATSVTFMGAIPIAVHYSHSLLSEADGELGIALVLSAAGTRRRFLAAVLLALGLNWRYTASVGPYLAMATPPAIGIAAVYLLLVNARFRTAAAMTALTAGAWLVYRRLPLPAWAARPRWNLPTLLAVSLAATVAILAVFPAVYLDPRLLQESTVLNKAFGGGPEPQLFSHLDFYPRLALWLVGPAFLAVLAAALPAAWRRRPEPAIALALAMLAGITLVLLVASDKAPRALAVMVPPAAVVAGGAPALLGRLSGVGAAAACAAMTINGWLTLPAVLELPTSAPQVAAWLAAHPQPYAARGADYEVYEPQLRRAADHGSTVAELRTAGVRYVVIDAAGPAFDSDLKVAPQLMTCAQPVATFNDPSHYSVFAALENADIAHAGYDEMLQRRDRALAATGGRQPVWIFDLETATGCP